MKWSLSTQQKLKAAGFLSGIMLVTLLTSVSMQQAMQAMDRTLVSVNANRLQPAVELVYLSESFHAKRLLMENQLTSESPLLMSDLKAQLRHHDEVIRQRLGEYQKTELTQREGRWLKTLQQRWSQSVQVERSVLRLLESGQEKTALHVFTNQGLLLFKQGVESLHELARIQSEAGHLAVRAAHRLAAGVSLETTLLIAISVILALIALHFVRKEQWPLQNRQPFHLN